MKSTKPRAICQFCQEHGLEFTSLDYSGHGETRTTTQDIHVESGESLTISQWIEEALHVLQAINDQQIAVGSSMGAWIAVLLAQCQQKQMNHGPGAQNNMNKISGILGVASAPDFTSILSQQIESDDHLIQQMNEQGYCNVPTRYDEAGFYRILGRFLEDAKKYFVLEGPSLQLDIPVTLIHGKEDSDVPYSNSEKLLSKLDCGDADKNELILLEDGDHRLSKPHELEQILKVLGRLRNRIVE